MAYYQRSEKGPEFCMVAIQKFGSCSYCRLCIDPDVLQSLEKNLDVFFGPR